MHTCSAADSGMLAVRAVWTRMCDVHNANIVADGEGGGMDGYVSGVNN